MKAVCILLPLFYTIYYIGLSYEKFRGMNYILHESLFGRKCLFGFKIIKNIILDHPNLHISWMDTSKDSSEHANEHLESSWVPLQQCLHCTPQPGRSKVAVKRARERSTRVRQ
jgi:hypothetical protein